MDHIFCFLTLTLAIFAAAVNGQSVNCNQMPVNPQDVKNCCKQPSLSIKKYKDFCYNNVTSIGIGRFRTKTSDKNAFMNPCAIECIYTQGGGYYNGSFVFPGMNKFIKEIMPNDTDLANVFQAGFKNCSQEVATKMKEYEATLPRNTQGKIQYPPPTPDCSPYAVITSFCAMRYAFINCPSNLWTSSDTCNSARNYVKNCEPMQFGGPKATAKTAG